MWAAHLPAQRLSVGIPPPLLQPLVENAVTHGIAALLALYGREGTLHIEVTATRFRVEVTLPLEDDEAAG